MSQVEAEHFLGEAAKTKNIADSKGRLIQKNKRYLRFNERVRKQEEHKRMEFLLSPANQVGAPALSSLGRQDLLRYKRALESELEADSPPDQLPGDVKDITINRERQLAEFISSGMQAEEEMRRNPAGAVARYNAWQRRTKDAINEWKNIRILNNPESDDPDLANVEILRPRMASPGQAATFMSDAQIPGQFAMTPQAKANFEQVFPESPTIDTPLKQIERRELEELRAQVAALQAQIVSKPAKAGKPISFWTCDQCGDEVDTRKKGMHIAKHRRDAKAAVIV